MKSLFKSLPHNPFVYPIGPLLPSGYGRYSVESSESEKGQVESDAQAFLKEMQSKYGERSVIFVGFLFDEQLGYSREFSDLVWNQLLAYSA